MEDLRKRKVVEKFFTRREPTPEEAKTMAKQILRVQKRNTLKQQFGEEATSKLPFDGLMPQWLWRVTPRYLDPATDRILDEEEERLPPPPQRGEFYSPPPKKMRRKVKIAN